MELSKKALDLIEKGILYTAEVETDRNWKGIILRNRAKTYCFKSSPSGFIVANIIKEKSLASMFPTTVEHLMKVMRAKHGAERARMKRADFVFHNGRNMTKDRRNYYIPQYSLKSC